LDTGGVTVGIRNRFRLNLNLVYKLLEHIPPEGAMPSVIRGYFPELGDEKVRSVKEWAADLGLVHQNARKVFLTPLGKAVLLTRGSRIETRIQEILYYKLATCPDLEVFRALVNVILFEVSKRFDPIFDVEDTKKQILTVEMATEAKAKYIQGEVSTSLHTLTNEESIGKLTIVVPVSNNRYRVNSYRPDWRSAAYIIYDSWPKNVSRMKISEVLSGRDSLGRIFFMTEAQVMALLSKLEQERVIALEVVADLNQIGRNPAMKAQDFLEMLIRDEG
jgi:hypothetical protein